MNGQVPASLARNVHVALLMDSESHIYLISQMKYACPSLKCFTMPYQDPFLQSIVLWPILLKEVNPWAMFILTTI